MPGTVCQHEMNSVVFLWSFCFILLCNFLFYRSFACFDLFLVLFFKCVCVLIFLFPFMKERKQNKVGWVRQWGGTGRGKNDIE